MNLDDYFYLGHFAKTYGVKGELILFVDADDASAYQGLDAFFMHEGASLLPYFIERMEAHGKSRFRVKLEDINSLEEAEILLKQDIYLPLAALPKLGDKQFYYHEIAGFKAIDQASKKAIGTVTGVMELPSNPLLQVDVDGKEALIPITDNTIVLVDRDAKQLTLQIPEGLLEMYLDEEIEDGEDY